MGRDYDGLQLYKFIFKTPPGAGYQVMHDGLLPFSCEIILLNRVTLLNKGQGLKKILDLGPPLMSWRYWLLE